MCALPSRFIKECNQVSNASAYCHEQRLIPNDGWLWRGSAWKQTRLEKKAEAEHEWRNHKESQRRWCREATCQTTATYGKPQSPWNWKTKVPASDKHYWLARSSNSSSSSDFSLFLDIFVFSCQISSSNCWLLASTHCPRVTKARAALHPHVRTLIQLAAQGFWVQRFSGCLTMIRSRNWRMRVSMAYWNTLCT